MGRMVGLSILAAACVDVVLAGVILPGRIPDPERRAVVTRALTISAVVLACLGLAFFFGLFPLA